MGHRLEIRTFLSVKLFSQEEAANRSPDGLISLRASPNQPCHFKYMQNAVCYLRLDRCSFSACICVRACVTATVVRQNPGRMVLRRHQTRFCTKLPQGRFGDTRNEKFDIGTYLHIYFNIITHHQCIQPDLTS